MQYFNLISGLSHVMLAATDTLTFDGPVGDLPVVSDARWSASLTIHPWGAFVVWILLLVILQAMTLPLVRAVFGRLPDRGWAFARILSLLLSGYLAWLVSALQIVPFTAISSWAAVILVAILSRYLAKLIGHSREDITQAFRRNPYAITEEIIFWGVFLFFMLLRLLNPDSYHPIWGGEKPMEFAYINSILRSAHFPPVDPWYAGGYINYYYYGFYLVAHMVKLTGIPLEVAFNLAQPTFPALLATAAFSLSAGIARRLMNSAVGAILSGFLGLFFIQFAGNMIVAVRTLQKAVNDIGGIADFSYWVFMPTRAIPDVGTSANGITEFPYFAGLYADLHPHTIAMPFTLLAIALAWQAATQARNMPYILAQRTVQRRELIRLVVLGLISSLTLGVIWMTNAWDMPMYAAVTAVGVVMLTSAFANLGKRLAYSVGIIAAIGVVAYLAALPFNLTYVALFSEVRMNTSDSPLLAIEAHLGAQLALLTLGVGALVAAQGRSRNKAPFATGLLAAAVIATALLAQWRAHTLQASWEPAANAAVVLSISAVWIYAAWRTIRANADFRISPMVSEIGCLIIVFAVLVTLATGREPMALYLAVGLSAGLMWLNMERPSERFLMALIAGGTLLGALIEVIFLADNLAGSETAYRMNTIFKFYNQIWNLLGIATAVMVGRAIRGMVAPDSEESEEPISATPRTGWRRDVIAWDRLTSFTAFPLMFCMALYPVVATPIRLDTTFDLNHHDVTLNAFDWMNYGEIPMSSRDGNLIAPLTYKDDLAAINWLNSNVHGSPVITEAVFGAYRCNGSRFSIATGLPSPIGWVGHQSQQRLNPDIWTREPEIRNLYTVADPTQQQSILDKYDVRYVIIGMTERHYPTIDQGRCVDTGNPAAISSLESLPTLTPVFRQGSTVIYEVRQN